MSSRSQLPRDRRAVRLAAFLLVIVVAQGYGPAPAAAAIPLPVIAVLPGDGQTSLVVDLGAGTAPTGRTTAVITVDGVPKTAQLAPVVSDHLAVALVIDTSEAGRTTLPAWLSAAARFILETPAETQAVVVADTSPPALIAAPQRGAMGIVSALDGVRAGGQRRTSDALTLALRRLPASPPGQRVVIVYTTAATAGGDSAAALSGRFQQAGAILVVVGSSVDSSYWSDATRATGGFFAPAGTPVVVPALDQVETTLQDRYLVRFPTPRVLPAWASVRINAGKLTLTGDVLIPEKAAGIHGSPPPRGAPGLRINLASVVIAGLLVLIAAALIVLRRSRRVRDTGLAPTSHDVPAPRPGPNPGPNPGPKPGPTPEVVRGRAAVAGTVVRGRASVPGSTAPGRAPVPDAGPGGTPSSPP